MVLLICVNYFLTDIAEAIPLQHSFAGWACFTAILFLVILHSFSLGLGAEFKISTRIRTLETSNWFKRMCPAPAVCAVDDTTILLMQPVLCRVERVTVKCARSQNRRLSRNCHSKPHKTGKNQQNPEN